MLLQPRKRKPLPLRIPQQQTRNLQHPHQLKKRVRKVLKLPTSLGHLRGSNATWDTMGRLWIAMGAMAVDPDCPEPTIGYGIPENCALEVNLATGERSYWGGELIVEMRRDTGSTHGYCNAPPIK